MESLPRGCELARPARCGAATLWRLFGLVPRDRRRSGFSAACDARRPGDNDLPPVASSRAPPLRSEARDDASVITPWFTGEVKIRGDRTGPVPFTSRCNNTDSRPFDVSRRKNDMFKAEWQLRTVLMVALVA